MTTTASGFSHTALIVDSDESLNERLVPALRRSLTVDEPVLMVVGTHTAQVVRGTLGADATRLQWGDPRAFYQRLGMAFSTFRRYLEGEHAAGRRVHVVAEPDIRTDTNPAAPLDRVGAYLPYESLCNDAYAPFGCPITCLWDSRRHPTLVIEGVRSLHTHELTAAGPVRNPGYISPLDYLTHRNQVGLDPAPVAVDLDHVLPSDHDLAALRAEIRTWAGHRRFSRTAVDDVLSATVEIATNGLQHGAPPVRVRGWERARTLVVQVDDRGGKPIPPLGGYVPPGTGSPRGYGLWVARQLADALTTHTTPGRTTVRLHFPYDVLHQAPV